MHDVKKRARTWAVKAGVCAAVLLSGGAVATAGDVVEMKEATAILDECVAAETSLLMTRSAAGNIDAAYRAALYASSAHVVNAYRLSLLAPWSADASSLRSKLSTSLVTTIGKLAGFDRPPASWSAADLRSALTKEAVRVHRATVLLEGIAPPPPPVPVPSSAPVATPGSSTDFAWTDLNPSADSKVYYVSSSTGSDTNDGLAPDRPLKSLRYSIGLLRDGYPDWMLLKRGDTWTGETFGMGKAWGASKSGRSASEPMVIWSYGTSTARPYLADCVFTTNNAEHVANLALVGLHFDRVNRTSSDAEFGIYMLSYGDNILLEDLYVENYNVNMHINAPSAAQPIRNLRIRGCVIADAHNGGMASGLLIGGVQGLVIEGNVVDHNGWRDATGVFGPSVFNHNMYLYYATSPVTIRNNIIARASSHGFTIPGGLVEDNLFLRNPIAMSTAHNATIRRNVVLDGANTADLPRGYAVWYDGGLDGGEIADNVFAHQVSGMGASPILMNAGMSGVSVHDNLVYKWQNFDPNWHTWQSVIYVQGAMSGTNTISNNQFQQTEGYLIALAGVPAAGVFNLSGNRYYSGTDQSQWFKASSNLSAQSWTTTMGETGSTFDQIAYPDPDRSVATYNGTLGGTATIDAFFAEARKQSRSSWRPAYAARAINEYIRQGFNKTVK